MLRIGLEIDCLMWPNRSGIPNHTVGVLRGFKSAGLTNCLTLFLNRKPITSIQPYYRDAVSGYRIKRFENAYKFAYQIRMKICSYTRQDVFQTMTTTYQPILQTRLNSFLIPDLTSILMPEYHLPENRDHWFRLYDTISNDSGLVITYSEHTRQEAVTHLGLKPERVVAIPLGYAAEYCHLPSDRVAAAVRLLGLVPGKYILNVGTLEPRKNHVLLFRAYAKLKDRGIVNGVPLVLAGGQGWLYESVLAELSRLGLNEDVRFVGFVDCLSELYNGAAVMVYPSRYEGFGLPPLEAMACGTPVIVSNTTSLPEVVGTAGVLVDPDDVDGLAEAIARVLTDSEHRLSLSTDGLNRASLFSWASCAKSMYAAYETAVARREGRHDVTQTRSDVMVT